METKKEAPEIPDFKLAKVGERRKRRRGGALPLFGQGAGRGVAGSIGSMEGGGGLMAALSSMGGKIAVALLAGALGVGAYGVGKVMAPDAGRFAASKKPQLFASKGEKPRYEGDLSSLPGGRPAQSGLGMVSGSLDGLTPEERAARAKAAENAAKAAAEAQAKADAEANKQQTGQAGAPVDPAALAAAAAAAGKDKGMDRKFGELGKVLGGGAGLSGGVSRGFDMPKFQSDPGKMLALAKGLPNVNYAKTRAAIVGRNPGRGLAQRQLNNAALLSNAARGAGRNESQASYAAAPFDNNPAAGTAITGIGAGEGGRPASGSGGGVAPNPVGGGGGSIGGDTSAADTGQDDCNALFPDGGYISCPSGGGGCCAKSEPGHSVDPTDIYFQILKVLAISAAAIAAIAAVLSIFEWTPHMKTAFMILGGILLGIGAAQAALGAIILSMGRTLEGGIFIVFGALTAVAGYLMYASAAAAAGKVWSNQAIMYTVVAGLTSAMQAGVGAYEITQVGPRTHNSTTDQWE